MTRETHAFDDDGGIPNSRLPVLIYHGALGPSAGAAAYDVLVLSAGNRATQRRIALRPARRRGVSTRDA